jgi:hypothetical protein
MTTDRAEKLLSEVPLSDFEEVVRVITSDSLATLHGHPTWTSIGAVHNDQRTIGILKITGQANTRTGVEDWSCIAKIVDPSADLTNATVAWMNLDVEEQVYDLGLMITAICYRTQRLDNSVKLFWLEDLSGAPQSPWTLDQYVSAARHIGEFNGHMATNPPDLPFELPVDGHISRRKLGNNPEAVASLYENRTHPLIKEALGDVPPERVVQLSDLWGKLHEISPDLPHATAFGDCHARNLFPLADETVAVDWAGLADEPIGADISVLIGSGLSWGLDEALMIIENEPMIYDSYVSGLASSGWTGDLSNVRRGFFTHFPLYLNVSAVLSERIRSGHADRRREFVEARFGSTLEEIPRKMPPITAHIPAYVDELRQLLA